MLLSYYLAPTYLFSMIFHSTFIFLTVESPTRPHHWLSTLTHIRIIHGTFRKTYHAWALFCLHWIRSPWVGLLEFFSFFLFFKKNSLGNPNSWLGLSTNQLHTHIFQLMPPAFCWHCSPRMESSSFSSWHADILLRLQSPALMPLPPWNQCHLKIIPCNTVHKKYGSF